MATAELMDVVAEVEDREEAMLAVETETELVLELAVLVLTFVVAADDDDVVVCPGTLVVSGDGALAAAAETLAADACFFAAVPDGALCLFRFPVLAFSDDELALAGVEVDFLSAVDVVAAVVLAVGVEVV